MTSGWRSSTDTEVAEARFEPRLETSVTRSGGTAPLAIAGWLALATLQVLSAFAATGDSDDEPVYTYGLAVAGVVFYSVLVALSLLIATG